MLFTLGTSGKLPALMVILMLYASFTFGAMSGAAAETPAEADIDVDKQVAEADFDASTEPDYPAPLDALEFELHTPADPYIEAAVVEATRNGYETALTVADIGAAVGYQHLRGIPADVLGIVFRIPIFGAAAAMIVMQLHQIGVLRGEGAI